VDPACALKLMRASTELTSKGRFGDALGPLRDALELVQKLHELEESTAAAREAADRAPKVCLLTVLPEHMLASMVWPAERVVEGICVGNSRLTQELLFAPRLRLSLDSLTGGRAHALGTTLARMCNLREVDLGGSRIGREGAEGLAGALVHVPNLRVLNLQGCSLGARGAQAIVPALPASLEALDLSANEFGPQGLEGLDPLPRRLTVLSVRDNQLGAMGAGILAPLLPKGLRHLDLGGNNIGAAGAEALGPHIPPTVEHLVLDQNRLGAGGAAALGPHLPVVLESLDVGFDELGDEGGAILWAHLPPGLLTLDMRGNRLEGLGLPLGEPLPTTLKHLNLAGNHIKEKSVRRLACHLPPALRQLVLRGNIIYGADHGALEARLLARTVPCTLTI